MAKKRKLEPGTTLKPYSPPVKTEARLKRMGQVMILALQGYSYRQIAQITHVSIMQVQRDLQEALEPYLKPDITLQRAIELARLETLHQSWWDKAREPSKEGQGAAYLVLKIGEQRAQILGLEAPQRTAILVGGDEEHPVAMKVKHEHTVERALEILGILEGAGAIVVSGRPGDPGGSDDPQADQVHPAPTDT